MPVPLFYAKPSHFYLPPNHHLPDCLEHPDPTIGATFWRDTPVNLWNSRIIQFSNCLNRG